MSQAIKIGLIGLDTSHVPAFTSLLNDPHAEHHVPGARVVAGYPGASDDFELSYSRVEQFTNQIRDEHGADVLDSPEAVAETADMLFITAADGRAHLGFMEKIAPAGKPVYIDKPLACSFAEAVRIFELAKEHGVPLMTCSNLRYADMLQEALSREAAAIRAVDLFGPMSLQEQVPGYYWYGVHQVEMAVAALGSGAVEVQAVSHPPHEVAVVRWDDGRFATIHGQEGIHHGFGVTLHRETGAEMLDLTRSKRPNYAMLLDRIMQTLARGASDVPAVEALTIMAIMEAANESRLGGGKAVKVPSIPAHVV